MFWPPILLLLRFISQVFSATRQSVRSVWRSKFTFEPMWWGRRFLYSSHIAPRPCYLLRRASTLFRWIDYELIMPRHPYCWVPRKAGGINISPAHLCVWTAAAHNPGDTTLLVTWLIRVIELDLHKTKTDPFTCPIFPKPHPRLITDIPYS
ncbi:hypothetical protein C8R44DRAFT_325195 [Mycena epipterygia]|nr:hypothetical protein C8R44DRAFT_325195 [Mycena epipterygia]